MIRVRRRASDLENSRLDVDCGFKGGLSPGSFPSSGASSAAAVCGMNGGAGFAGKWLLCGVKCGGRRRTRLLTVTSRGAVNHFKSSENVISVPKTTGGVLFLTVFGEKSGV